MHLAIIRLPEVKKRTGYSRSQIYDLIRRKKFPQQVELGEHAVGWVESEIQEWIVGRINRTRQKVTQGGGM